jgi:conjugal transfer pilus assembly protein TraB
MANPFSNLTTKQKHRLKVFGLIGVVALVIILSVSLTGKKVEKKEDNIRKDRKFSVLSEKVEKDLWIAAESQNVKALEKSNEEFKAELEKIRKELETQKEVQKQALKNPPAPQKMDAKTPGKFPPGPPGKVSKMPGAGPDGMPPIPPPVPPEPTRKGTPPGGAKPSEPASAIKVWQPDSRQSSKGNALKSETDYVWVPTGSITKAVILSGMDVPSSLKAKSEPYPVLLMLSDYSLLPNRFRMDMKECFIIGAGYGNMVEERAYIRTETLSCIKNDGTPWEVSLKGQVVGEDGKLGLRGNVVTKQGRQIALAVTTGILSGLSTAMQPQTAMSFVRIDKDDTDNKMKTITPDLKDVGLGAGLSGIGSALGRISDYYLKLAEQMYPVIEIEAGREIEIIVVKGGKLTPQESSKEVKQETKTGGDSAPRKASPFTRR